MVNNETHYNLFILLNLPTRKHVGGCVRVRLVTTPTGRPCPSSTCAHMEESMLSVS